jgi:tartronate-semialdehyde synthase
VPVIPTLMGWGTIPDDHPLMAGMCGLQTSHRYGNATMLASDFVLGIGNRWANRHTGSVEVYCKGRKFVHVDIEPTQIGRVFAPDYGIVSDAKAALEPPSSRWRASGRPPASCATGRPGSRSARAQAHAAAQDHFDNVPMKPQRVYEEMNNAFGKDACLRQRPSACQIAAAQFLHVYKPRHWINCGQAGPLGWTVPAALGVCAADPNAAMVALSGDYDFQFMIEELAVGAQFKLPYIHVLVNNSLPRPDPPVAARLRHGLLRAARVREHQRGSGDRRLWRRPRRRGRGPGLQGDPRAHAGRDPAGLRSRPRQWMEEFRVPVVVEIILERVTNIAMGTEIDNINEFEELAERGEDAPTAISMLD